MKRHILIAAILFAPLCCAHNTLAVTQYSITDLGTLSGPIGNSFPRAMNANGEVVGVSNDHAFLYSGGTMTDLGTLGGDRSTPNGINVSGQVVGSSFINGLTDERAFLYSGGTMSNIDNWIGSIGSSANGINSTGVVVGTFTNLSNSPRAFVYSAGTMSDLGTLGGSAGSATAINSAGQIAGDSSIIGDAATHAFRYDGGVMTDLGTLGGNDSHATAINASGQVVGYSAEDGADYRAFLYSGGMMTDLGGWGFSTNSQAMAINDDGDIVGTNGFSAFLYTDGTAYDLNLLFDANPDAFNADIAAGINDAGQILAGAFSPLVGYHAILLTPVPEPSTIILTGLGIVGLIGCARRGKANS